MESIYCKKIVRSLKEAAEVRFPKIDKYSNNLSLIDINHRSFLTKVAKKNMFVEKKNTSLLPKKTKISSQYKKKQVFPPLLSQLNLL